MASTRCLHAVPWPCQVRWNLLVNEQDQGARNGELGALGASQAYTDYRGPTGDGVLKGGYRVLLDALAAAAGGAERIVLGDAVTLGEGRAAILPHFPALFTEGIPTNDGKWQWTMTVRPSCR